MAGGHEPARAGRLRIGLCGNGHWAKSVHLPALAAMPEVELVGVWGRRHEQSMDLASQFETKSFADFEVMLDEVDAVSFAVPPDVQAGLALQAAEAGKHLLLEKPIATNTEDADRLVDVVQQRRLSTVTFLTRLFVDEANALVQRARAVGPNRCEAKWSSTALLPGTPFTNSGWRNGDSGTLWDLGPHVLTILVQVFGPVIEVEAIRVRKAKFTGRLRHADGAESVFSLDQMDESRPKGSLEQYTFSGDSVVVQGGPFSVQPIVCFAAAVRLLIDGVGGASGHAAQNIAINRDIVAVLEAASVSIDAGGAPVLVRH